MNKAKHPFLTGSLWIAIAVFLAMALGYYDPRQCPFHTTLLRAHEYAKNPAGMCGAYVAFFGFRLLGAAFWLLPVYGFWLGIVSWAKKLPLFLLKHFIAFVVGFFAIAALLANLQHVHFKGIGNANYFSAGLGGLFGGWISSQHVEAFLGSIGTTFFFAAFGFICLPFAFLGDLTPPAWLSPLNLLGAFFRKLRSIRFKMPTREPEAGSNDVVPQTPLKSSVQQDENPAQVADSAQEVVPSFSLFKRASSEESEEPKTALRALFGRSREKEVAKTPQKAPGVERVGQNSDLTLDNIGVGIGVLDGGIKIVAAEPLQKASQVPHRANLDDYPFPPMSLLKQPDQSDLAHSAAAQNHQKRAELLVAKLAEFGVDVKVQEIHSGPVITRYEVTPSPGVRVERIINLEKNIALGLKATSVRIVAPVPGKGCVGIELPNEYPLPVCLREIIESKAWSHANAEIPIVLGKEVTGKPIVADLTRMPHLLIAGSTGSGKTVCINTIIASLLFHSSPDDLRFIMVDPKIVEMKIYNDLPHMLIPVVTDPKKVPSALKWLIGEMERRYHVFAKAGARNIASYNAKPMVEDFVKIPYIVCIVDELADLMMVAPADIETCVARLAQLARAAGIHLILATQRPSVNVITGIIKANLPSRIAFKVASKVDSRTILDYGGADSLIGRGDMLFVPPGASTIIRAQGAFVSDDEIASIVQFIKDNGPPVNYVQEVQDQIDHSDDDEDGPSADSEEAWDDDLIPKAIGVIRSNERASTSLLQRRLRIGYNRAARIMDILQERGIVGPENGQQGRDVLPPQP